MSIIDEIWVIHLQKVDTLLLLLSLFFFFFVEIFIFYYRQHIHHITSTEQDKHITSVNDIYCYLCAQHITTFFLKSIVIVITTLFPPNHYLFINI
jgi:hypothetical protein